MLRLQEWEAMSTHRCCFVRLSWLSHSRNGRWRKATVATDEGLDAPLDGALLVDAVAATPYLQTKDPSNDWLRTVLDERSWWVERRRPSKHTEFIQTDVLAFFLCVCVRVRAGV